MAGHYNFSQKAWGGMAGMKKAVAQINAAGLKAGMHTMSGNIGKNDAYVQPVPDPRLAKTDLNTLATIQVTRHSERPWEGGCTRMKTSGMIYIMFVGRWYMLVQTSPYLAVKGSLLYMLPPA